MKKMICILLAVMMLGTFACAAAEESAPQPEGGKKFESNWAIAGGLVEIWYEEVGYRVFITLDGGDSGTEWEYSCYYHEDTDSLVSVSSTRTDYLVDPDTGDKTYAEPAYEGLDDENQGAEFTLDEHGCLNWNDKREQAGHDLEFRNIGSFQGVWKNPAAETEVEFIWDGTDQDHFNYTVYILRGNTGADRYASYLMTGVYDPETGKLTADGTCTVFTRKADGEYESSDDGEMYDAVFSKTPDGKLLYETDNGIELEYDLMGHEG